MFKSETIFNASKILVSICGGWWSLMSGAVSIPFAFIALLSHGHEKRYFALLAFCALWVLAIRTAWKNYQIANPKEKGKPLEIEALPPKMLSATDLYACEIRVHNENQSVDRVNLKLVTVEPPFLGSGRPSNLCDLDYIKFSLDGTHESIIAGKSDCRIVIFTAQRSAEGIVLKFSGQWASEWANEFAPVIKSENGEYGMYPVFAEHILTFETSATGVDAHSTKFKLLFSSNRNNPAFILENITDSETNIDKEKAQEAVKQLTEFGMVFAKRISRIKGIAPDKYNPDNDDETWDAIHQSAAYIVLILTPEAARVFDEGIKDIHGVSLPHDGLGSTIYEDRHKEVLAKLNRRLMNLKHIIDEIDKYIK